jgi:hypothetical protein
MEYLKEQRKFLWLDGVPERGEESTPVLQRDIDGKNVAWTPDEFAAQLAPFVTAVGVPGQNKYVALLVLSAQISKLTVFRNGTPTPQFEQFQDGELQRLVAVASHKGA